MPKKLQDPTAKAVENLPQSPSFGRLAMTCDGVFKPITGSFGALPRNARGAIWVIIAGLFFTVMTALIKMIGDTIPVVQILLFRQIVMTCTVMPVLVLGFPGSLKTNFLKLHLARVMFAVVGMTCGFTALVNLPLAEATALGFAKSLFVAIFAVLLLREVAGPRRWFAVVIGFVGILIMTQPGGCGFNIYSLLAIAGAASAAAVMVIIRKITQFERPVPILSYQSILVGLIMIPPTLVYWVQPSLYEWLVMAAIGVLSVFGQLANIQGFKEGNASAVAPMDYTRLVFAAMIGFLLFGEIPEWTTAIGAGLVIATSLYTVRAEARAGESAL